MPDPRPPAAGASLRVFAAQAFYRPVSLRDRSLSGFGAAGGGYGNTNEGKIIAAAFLDNYNNVVILFCLNAERNNWEPRVMEDTFKALMAIIPTICGMCHFHIIRSAKDYV